MIEKIAAVIIVYNEEIHIGRCLESIHSLVDEIHIIDSYSTDATTKIAAEFGATIHQVAWENSYSKKYNWGLDNIQTKCEWILRLDADEIVTDDLSAELRALFTQKKLINFNAVKLPRVIKFLGHELLHGSMQPTYMLRLFRAGLGVCESKLMDEHIVVQAECGFTTKNHFIDDNQKGWADWVLKHNTYALKEAIDSLQRRDNKMVNQLASGSPKLDQVRKKRRYKGWYDKLPLFLRPVLYFLYRYILRGGFRDGFSGFSWHFMQGLWYRMLVDIKIFEISRDIAQQNISLENYVQNRYGFSITFK